jgi:hypothetical protein
MTKLTLEGVLSLNLLLDSCVLVGKLFSLSDHSVNIVGAQSSLVVGDGDRLGLASALVVGRDLEDTIGINLKGDFDLRNSSWRRGDFGKVKLSKVVVVLGHGSFSFEYLDSDSGLVVDGSREDLGLLGGDNRVSANELGHDTTSGLDTCLSDQVKDTSVESRRTYQESRGRHQ